ncbi:Gag polyprotein [Plecturocebus cupreus]
MWMVNAAFIVQLALDIHWKLQKLDSCAGMKATQLLEVANKVFVNQDLYAQREADKQMKQKATLLAVVFSRPDPTQHPGPPHKVGKSRCPPLWPDQCAYCKKVGH